MGAAGVGVQAGEGENLADQCLQAVALLGQAPPQLLAFRRPGPFGQGQRHAQARQRRAQFVGDVAQQLALAADQTLQARAHAVEVAGQHAEFVAPCGQTGQAVLLIGGLPEVVHGAAQAAERTSNGEGQ